MSDLAFTSDWHLGHKRILELGNGRPFASIEEHDAAIIENVNKKFPKGRLYFTGDLCFGGSERIAEVLRQIKAEFFWIRGNHDPKKLKPEVAAHVAWFGDYKEIHQEGQYIVLSHFPFLTWHKAHYGAWMIHGHSHNNLAPTTQPRVDCGVDGHNFEPWTYEEMQELMTSRSYSGVDHHDEDKSFTKAQALDQTMLYLAERVPGQVDAGDLLDKISTTLHGSEG